VTVSAPRPQRPLILLTGATGYIGSHTWLALQAAGFAVVGLDDFSNSSPEVLNRIEQLSGTAPVFERASVCDADGLNRSGDSSPAPHSRFANVFGPKWMRP
jgi:UDP-glucose 4-epimerase